jgi:hypothetical protein
MAEFIFPLPYIPDPSQGRPLANGSLFFGLPDLDPKILANQVPVSVIQENGIVVPVTQPIMTGAGGVPIYNGSPVEISVSASEYSFKALNSQGGQVYFIPRVEENLEQQVADLEQRVDDLEQDVDDLEQEDMAIRATQGVALGAVNLGTFPGSLIPNNQSVKGALTTLEDEAQDVRTLTGTALGAINLGAFSNSLLPSSQNLKQTFEQFADNIQDELDGQITATASTPGNITIPYSSTNAIVINWGTITIAANTAAFDTFQQPYTASPFAYVCSYAPIGVVVTDLENPCAVVSVTTTQIRIVNGNDAPAPITWIAAGRLAI